MKRIRTGIRSTKKKERDKQHSNSETKEQEEGRNKQEGIQSQVVHAIKSHQRRQAIFFVMVCW